MRITKKFSGASVLGKRVFHASAGRQREERLSRVASQQTLAAAQRELSMLEARFVDAVSRSAESMDARMIDLEARFLHSSNVVSTPAIDAFIMQSCGGSLWDPDGVATKLRQPDDTSSRDALAAATATHLAIDPSAYAEGAVPDAAALAHGYSELEKTPQFGGQNYSANHVVAAAEQQQQRAASSSPAAEEQQSPLPREEDSFLNANEHAPQGYYSEDPYAQQPYLAQQHYAQEQYPQEQYAQDGNYYYAQQQPQDYNYAGEHRTVEAQFQHLVKQQHDPVFMNASRASQDQHHADQQRINRWMATSKVGDLHPSDQQPPPPQSVAQPQQQQVPPPSQSSPPSAPPAEDDVLPAATTHEEGAPPLPFPAPPVVDVTAPPPTEEVPVPAAVAPPERSQDPPPLQQQQLPEPQAQQPTTTTTTTTTKDNSEAHAGGLLLGFVKSLRRSESHNELVDFVEDVNERAALHRKASATCLADLANDHKRAAAYDDGPRPAKRHDAGADHRSSPP